MSIRRATVPGGVANRIESLLSARLFLEPQLADGRIALLGYSALDRLIENGRLSLRAGKIGVR